MEPYEGNEPFLFVSYSHADKEKVEKFIVGLQKRLCYLWYDRGNRAGNDWAEVIARHLVDAHCVLLFISNNSVKSINVNNELTMALNYKKLVIPVYIDNVKLPLGWEIKISNLHAVSMLNSTERDIDLLLREIPAEVFKITSSPFYRNEKHSFYFLSEEVRENFEGKLRIVCETDGKREDIWSYVTPGRYEICPVRNSNEKDKFGMSPVIVNMHGQVKDDFFNMKDNGCVIFSVRVALHLPYPLLGPEGDGVIIFALINPSGDKPRIRVLDSMTSYDPCEIMNEKTPGYEYVPDIDPSAYDYGIMKILPKN